MSRIDDLLSEALHHPERPTEPSPDLFDRVFDSIDSDAVRRRHNRHLIAAWAVVATLAAGVVAILLDRNQNGESTMPWWLLEVITDVVLIGIALWLGPFIKRFGRAYAADVFHDNPQTGKSYIVLTDIVYYLIFTACILFTLRFEPDKEWSIVQPVTEVTAGQLNVEVVRIGGILLIIGILHGLNIVLMPILGRLFSLNRRVGPHA